MTTVIWALPMMALWLALTDTLYWLELVVGAACSLVAAAVLQAAAGAAPGPGFAPRRAWVLRALAAPWWMVRDTVVVERALLAHLLLRRPLRGEMVAVALPEGGDDPRSAARRTLAFTAGSAGANTYAIAWSEGVLVLHRLVDTGELTPVDLVAEP